MCDCADELERRREPSPIPPPSESGTSWLAVLGGASSLLAIIALLYKSWDSIKEFFWRGDSCREIIKKQKQLDKQQYEKLKVCICKD